MTTKPATDKYIGQRAEYACGKLKITVLITDHRVCFGRDDVLITPATGTGEQWVDVQSVTLN